MIDAFNFASYSKEFFLNHVFLMPYKKKERTAEKNASYIFDMKVMKVLFLNHQFISYFIFDFHSNLYNDLIFT